MYVAKWFGLAVLLLGCSSNSGGGVVCDSSGGGSAALDRSPICNVTFDNCKDGNTYSVACPGSPASCTSRRNGPEESLCSRSGTRTAP